MCLLVHIFTILIRNICLGPDWTLEPKSQWFPTKNVDKILTRVHSDMMFMGCSVIKHVISMNVHLLNDTYTCTGLCVYVLKGTGTCLWQPITCCFHHVVSSPVELDTPEMRLEAKPVFPTHKGDFAAGSCHPTPAGDFLTCEASLISARVGEYLNCIIVTAIDSSTSYSQIQASFCCGWALSTLR